MKKAQITFFMILGVIIVFAAATMFFFSSQTKEEVGLSDTERASKELFSSARVKSFVTNCLSTSLEEGLEVLGRQSGYITRECNGNIFDDFPTVLYDRTVMPGNLYLDNRSNKCNDSLNYSVIYLIRKNNVYPPPSEYPSVNFTENGTPVNLGRSSLPDLRDSDFSWERQLDSFVKANVEDCLDFSNFEEGVYAGNVTATTSINEFDVTSNLNVTVVIDGKPITELTDFKITERIRVSELYEFVDELISRDNSFLAFNMWKDYKALPSWKSGFSLSIINISNTTDIIVINDSLSSLYAEDYVFVFARENRPPVISYIKDVPTGGDKRTVSPLILDPDEDYLDELIVWDDGTTGSESPDPLSSSCPNSACFANITIWDPEGLNDSQRFKVYVP